MRAFMVLLLMPLSAASCGKDRGPVKPPPPPTGQIVFYGSDSTAYTHLFVVNADGTGLRQITSEPMNDSKPRWSPDGRRIVFIRVYGSQNDSGNVTVINADGSGVLRLTQNQYLANTPSWSPNGTQIAYHGDDPFQLYLWVIDSDGTNAHVLMTPDSTNNSHDITWTRQGTLLGDDYEGIDLQLSPTATRLTRIVELRPMLDGNPRLSPDGSRIAFSWAGPNASQGPYIYTIKPDGTDMQQMTYGHDTSPVWSPDGTHIAYVSDGRVWIMRADGTQPTQVTNRFSSSVDYLGDWK